MSPKKVNSPNSPATKKNAPINFISVVLNSFIVVLFFQNALHTTFVYETWLGFRSGVLSHVTKRKLKN